MGEDKQETTVDKEVTTTTATTVYEEEMKDASDSKDDADSSSGSKHSDKPEDAEMKDAGDKSGDNKDADESDDKKEEPENPKEKKEEAEEEKQKSEELRKKYANSPLENIKVPHNNDVMCGRGGGTNHHPGNKKYRKFVEEKALDYGNSKRLDKPLMALYIIRTWRTQVPPGRFLEMDKKTGLWNDVGDKKAKKKTLQALRENAPLIRKQQEDERKEEAGEEEDDPKVGEARTTRFAEGTKEESNQVNKPVLERDHSLGREYLQAGEKVSLEGFSWQDPFKRESAQSDPASSLPIPPPPASSYPPGFRNSSHGSIGMAPPHHVTSAGGPPPPPNYYGRDDRQREFSSGRYESWGTPYAYPPPPPAARGPHHQRSGSWTQAPPSPSPHGAHHQRSGSWNHAPPLRSGSGSGREHSLAAYPLVGASLSQQAPSSVFNSSGSGSGHWREPMTPTTSTTRSPPPPGMYGRQAGPYRSPSNSVTPPPNNNTPSPQNHHVDPSIANQWSGGEVKRTWSGDEEMKRTWSEFQKVKRTWSGDQEMRSWSREYDGRPAPYASADNSPMRLKRDSSNKSNLPRPSMVKRDTSNQNETCETKPSIKRAALNRDNSAATNRLKEQYMPEFYSNGRFDSEQEMRTLSDNLEVSTLDTPRGRAGLMPRPLKDAERTSSIDAISMDLMVEPAPFIEGNRTTTIDALDLHLGLDGDPIIHPSEMRREESREERIADLQRGLPKPNTMTADNRLTTKDFFDYLNEPDEHPSEMRREESREERIADLKRGAHKPRTSTVDNRLSTLDFLNIDNDETDDPIMAETVLTSWVGSMASTKTTPSKPATVRPFVTSPYPSTSTLVIRSQLQTVFRHLINVPPDGNCGYHILQEFRSRNGNHEMVPTADFRKSIRGYFDDNQESLLGENKYFRRVPLATRNTNGKARDQVVSDNMNTIFEEGIDFQQGCGNRHWLAAEWTFPIAVLKFRMNIVVYQDDYGNGAGNTERFTWNEGGDVHYAMGFGRVTLDDPLVENTMYAAHVNGNHYILLDM